MFHVKHLYSCLTKHAKSFSVAKNLRIRKFESLIAAIRGYPLCKIPGREPTSSITLDLPPNRTALTFRIRLLFANWASSYGIPRFSLVHSAKFSYHNVKYTYHEEEMQGKRCRSGTAHGTLLLPCSSWKRTNPHPRRKRPKAARPSPRAASRADRKSVV